MDAERFGRALGRGVRATAMALAEAADAATAPAKTAAGVRQPRPEAPPTKPGKPTVRKSTTSTGDAGKWSQHAASSVRVAAGSARKSFWAPAARAGGVLWLELTGSFFALFALAAAIELWRRRLELASGQGGRTWFAVAMLLIFGWFSVSSFVRARRRSRS